MKTPLPEAIKPGEAFEAQICPFGEFRNRKKSGEEVLQLCDEVAFNAVIANFKEEVLVDFEHNAELGGDTTAAAWISKARLDPVRGLVGMFLFTDAGADAVNNRRLRFLSPAWPTDADGRPTRLISVGLTNKPAILVDPVLNKEPIEPLTNPAPADNNKGTPKMNEIAKALGLAEGAAEADIVAAIEALKKKTADMESAALNAEAAACADKNADLVANREEFISTYVLNRDLALRFLGSVKAPEKKPDLVCNKQQAQTPTLPQAKAEDDDAAILNTYKGMKPGAEKDRFMVLNKAVLSKQMR
jgi:phage I-like protein